MRRGLDPDTGRVPGCDPRRRTDTEDVDQVLLWMVVALVAAAAVIAVVLREQRRAAGNVSSPGMRGFLADFRAGWRDIRAERIARRHPDQAPAVATSLAPELVDTHLDQVFTWAEPDLGVDSRLVSMLRRRDHEDGAQHEHDDPAEHDTRSDRAAS